MPLAHIHTHAHAPRTPCLRTPRTQEKPPPLRPGKPGKPPKPGRPGKPGKPGASHKRHKVKVPPIIKSFRTKLRKAKVNIRKWLQQADDDGDGTLTSAEFTNGLVVCTVVLRGCTRGVGACARCGAVQCSAVRAV